MRTTVLMAGLVLALAACGGGASTTSSTRLGAAPASPAGSPNEAALAFLKAARDSNVTRMAELWGTASGSAAQTNQPNDYQRRVVVLQTFLRTDSSKVVGEAAVPGNDARRTVTIAMYRQGCAKQVPFSMVRTRDGSWLVQEVDLALTGNPARPCETEPPPDVDR